MGQILHVVQIVDIGDMVAYCYQSAQEIADKAIHKNVYWRNKSSGHAYGPFPSLFDAMTHYSWLVGAQKRTETLAPVIFVDFHTKKRVIYK